MMTVISSVKTVKSAWFISITGESVYAGMRSCRRALRVPCRFSILTENNFKNAFLRSKGFFPRLRQCGVVFFRVPAFFPHNPQPFYFRRV
jgi:hypothetical protein